VAELASVDSYQVRIDLRANGAMFRSRSEVRFRAVPGGNGIFADLQAHDVTQATLNGIPLDVAASWGGARLQVPAREPDNLLVVDAEFGYVAEGEGLYRASDPASDAAFVYSKAYRGGVARIYSCFDRPDLRAPVQLTVLAPAEWTCLSNAPAEARSATQVTEGSWRFEPTPPVTPGITSLCAGPYDATELRCARELGPPLPVRILAPPSSRSLLTPSRLLEMLRGPLQYYERRLGIGYPYRKCDLLFVPGFPGLAFSAPGLIAVRDRALRPEPGDHELYLPLVIAHELAHAWIGGLAAIGTADALELWLTEALATYLSRMAVAELTGSAALADPAAAPALPGRAYGGYAAVISQLEAMIGADAVIGGLGGFLRQHAHACAPVGELVCCWSEAAGRDLGDWARESLRPPAG
jgi:aminopeptidase N